MAYQRAQWHSGLTYQQTCETCKTVFRYTDDVLDFRPWYADGYVDCPKCKSHLRHNERYAVDAPENPQPQVIDSTGARFCTNCGHQLGENDRFCAMCGTKRG